MSPSPAHPASTGRSADTLGGRITEARTALGLSTAQVARRLGVQTKTLTAWERDQSEPRANRLLMLAGMLNVPSFWLLSGGEAIRPDSTTANPELAGLQAQLDRAQELIGSLNAVIEDLSLRVRNLSEEAHE
ncbi:MAG: helix-turn-helix domain-containing protein [Alphaproteobacteria bacterium]|nr:helix-turn-helix domain-containing protein [Alphaproteobacteria bacterium]